MSLSSALNVAQSSLTATGLQSSIVSRNVAGQADPSYNRKAGTLVTTYGGAVSVSGVSRAMNTVLFTNKLAATASTSGQKAIVDGLERLNATVNDPELGQSLAAGLGRLTNALQQYSTTPDDPILAQGVLTAAKDMAVALNDADQTVRTVREQADADMADGVSRINDLLAQFEEVNGLIVKGTLAGSDITDQLDTRDRILAGLSQEMGISVATRANNDMVIYTDSGVTLFETVARSVTMAPSFTLPAGATGQAVYVDGVPVVGPGSIMPVSTGRIFGNAQVRDNYAVTYQLQIDEMARNLIGVFSEPTGDGLFTSPVAPPATDPGIAGRIRTNAAADPSVGGNLDLIRDGFTTAYNPTGAASFDDRLQAILTTLGQDRTFDPATGVDTSNSLAGFAASSVGWLQAARQSADNALGYETALLERTTEALSNVTGVNVDEEMTLLMELERSYGAASTLITTVDRMLATLLDAVR